MDETKSNSRKFDFLKTVLEYFSQRVKEAFSKFFKSENILIDRLLQDSQ
jgi:hypothetical protein